MTKDEFWERLATKFDSCGDCVIRSECDAQLNLPKDYDENDDTGKSKYLCYDLRKYYEALPD